MIEDDFSQAERIFLQAAELETPQRAAFVASACAADDALRREVESLLEAAEGSEEFFGSLAGRIGIAEILEVAEKRTEIVKAGDRIGPYKLTKRISSGGMGTVWCAERSDGRFEGRVAVKLLTRQTRRGALRRFDREAHYLAKLTHPNIARLIDAGLGPKDAPYLILEYVEGASIDRYCDARSLSIDNRVQLFIGVLDAVAHAHAHLIVHSDIKPSNVLVAADGTVKLLDFGISRLLSDSDDDDGKSTEHAVALTPEFAAPEQLVDAELTTSTDVYSLGLLLYMLLAGSSPRRLDGVSSIAELRAAAMEEAPSLASTITETRFPSTEALARLARERSASPQKLLKTLQGDLDRIVSKSLAVRPQDRYQTAADFATDLRRYLKCETVSALPDTLDYRAKKFMQRHRGAVLSAALTVLALVAAVAITTWQSVEERRQRDAAVYQQQRAQATNEFLTFLFEEVGPQGRPLTAAELLDRGLMLLEQQYGEEQRFAGAMYYDIAQRYAGLGQADRTGELLGRAETIARSQGDDDLLATTLCALARNAYRIDPDAAKMQVDEAAALLQSRAGPSTETNVSCARAEAILLELARQPQAALEHLQATLHRHTRSPFASVHTEGVLLTDISNMHYKMGRIDLAIDGSENILELHQRTGRSNSIGNLIVSLNRAALLQTVGEVTNAVEAIGALIDRVRELEARGQAPTGFWLSYAGGLLRLARYDEALPFLLDERARAEEAGDMTMLAQANAQIGRTLAFSGRAAEAVPYLDQAQEYLLRTPGVSRRALQIVTAGRVQALLVLGQVEEAQRVSEQSLNEVRAASGARSALLANALRIAANAALMSGNARRAEQYATEFHDIAVAQARDVTMSADVGQALLLRATARSMAGDTKGGKSDAEAALPSLTNGLGQRHPDTLAARDLILGQ
jgi:serine/threonine-protein kinase